MQKLLAALCSFAMAATLANAQSFFGGTDLDYWKEGPRPMARPLKPELQKPKETGRTPDSKEAEKVTIATSAIRANDTRPFNWSDYSDPKSIFFWDDGGDWAPPRPFREVASNPTPENVNQYITWLNKKGEVAARVQSALDERVSEGRPKPSSQSPNPQPTRPRRELDLRKLDLIYFYQTTCPHCQRSVGVVEQLRKMGARVIAVQLDYKIEPPLHKGSVPYTDKLRSEHPISATPSWIFSYENQTFNREGFITISDIYDIVDIGL
ncbi:MAG TPA: hypothetical protein VE954_00660 [Oligoflexus sp.]|uniref:hypothetical protein n=1 Tax=Oligoflexus sp. TaxID=1971216 RepID=UPI002D22FFE0|nr:hypothetical protein [Oligoflexus sp.]HYX31590.1 hypothetical protein [Oligoflexus sp.]